jgi:5-methylcytosine-specific restriction protein A
MPACSKCGQLFTAPTHVNGGRPRTRCDRCRTNHARIDGAKWRKARAQVLREEPVCRVCGAPSEEVDHIIPLQAGGDPYARANLQGLCKRHNASKGARVATQRPRQLKRWNL